MGGGGDGGGGEGGQGGSNGLLSQHPSQWHSDAMAPRSAISEHFSPTFFQYKHVSWVPSALVRHGL